MFLEMLRWLRFLAELGLYGRTLVDLSIRPHFYIFNDLSSESVHDVDGLSSSTVQYGR